MSTRLGTPPTQPPSLQGQCTAAAVLVTGCWCACGEWLGLALGRSLLCMLIILWGWVFACWAFTEKAGSPTEKPASGTCRSKTPCCGSTPCGLHSAGRYKTYGAAYSYRVLRHLWDRSGSARCYISKRTLAEQMIRGHLKQQGLLPEDTAGCVTGKPAAVWCKVFWGMVGEGPQTGPINRAHSKQRQLLQELKRAPEAELEKQRRCGLAWQSALDRFQFSAPVQGDLKFSGAPCQDPEGPGFSFGRSLRIRRRMARMRKSGLVDNTDACEGGRGRKRMRRSGEWNCPMKQVARIPERCVQLCMVLLFMLLFIKQVACMSSHSLAHSCCRFMVPYFMAMHLQHRGDTLAAHVWEEICCQAVGKIFIHGPLQFSENVLLPLWIDVHTLGLVPRFEHISTALFLQSDLPQNCISGLIVGC